jgi:hypothetical protein
VYTMLKRDNAVLGNVKEIYLLLRNTKCYYYYDVRTPYSVCGGFILGGPSRMLYILYLANCSHYLY